MEISSKDRKSMGVFIFKRYIKDKERFRRWNLQEGRIKIGFPNV